MATWGSKQQAEELLSSKTSDELANATSGDGIYDAITTLIKQINYLREDVYKMHDWIEDAFAGQQSDSSKMKLSTIEFNDKGEIKFVNPATNKVHTVSSKVK